MAKATEIGQKAENRALEYLESNGLKLVERNYRCNRGEIDLIMDDAGTLVFVEVRYRKQNHFGSALESINRTKQKKIILSTKHYLAHHPEDSPVRFDAIALSPTGTRLEIQWVKSAFEAWD
ncbi:MAG: YraN family protein [Gammaproteobacteria bacterium]|nr:MAG: YraN family protein [Gammaproteobacteria bacterium]RLA21752.1 MAG: YraN family protein [Gammaproteobacteria bacterium]